MATYYDPELDPDMAFCKSLRDNKISMFVMNREDYGHLVNFEKWKQAKTLYEFTAKDIDGNEVLIHSLK